MELIEGLLESACSVGYVFVAFVLLAVLIFGFEMVSIFGSFVFSCFLLRWVHPKPPLYAAEHCSLDLSNFCIFLLASEKVFQRTKECYDHLDTVRSVHPEPPLFATEQHSYYY